MGCANPPISAANACAALTNGAMNDVQIAEELLADASPSTVPVDLPGRGTSFAFAYKRIEAPRASADP